MPRPEQHTLQYMREMLDYSPAGQGALIWRHGRLRGELAGTETGAAQELRVRLEGRSYLAAKVALFLALGSWPEGRIRFINGDRTDIRIDNLEETDRQEGPGR